MTRTASLAAALLALLAAGAARGQDAPPPRVEPLVDEWHLVFSAGRRTGYAHVGFGRMVLGGRKVISGEKVVDLTLGSVEHPLPVRLITRSRELEDEGKLLEIETTRQVGETTRRAFCRIEEGRAELSLEGSAPSSFPVPEGIAGPYASYLAVRAAAKKGVEAVCAEYDPFTGTVEWTRKPAGEESLPVFGKTLLLRRFVAAEKGGATLSEWRDPEGRLLRTHDPREDLVTVASSAEEATGVASDYKVVVPAGPRPEKGASFLFLFEGALASFGLEAPNQTVEAAGSGVRVTVDRPAPFPPTVERPVSGGMDAAGFLGFDRFTDWMNPAVRKKAAELTVSIPDALEAALALVKWVGSNVSPSEPGPFHTAPEALSAGASSGIGRAILCCALCRGASIPARTVAGLKTDGAQMRLAFWIEAFVGQWVALDPEEPEGLAEQDQLRLRALDTRSQHPEAFFSALAFDLQKTKLRRG